MGKIKSINKLHKYFNMKKELKKYNAAAYWWNFGTKKLDFSGNLFDLLTHKHIEVKKVKDKEHPHLECYLFTTCHMVKYKHFGNIFDGAFTALKLYYATMGDKTIVDVCGRQFTINH